MSEDTFNVLDTAQSQKIFHAVRARWRVARMFDWVQEDRRDSQAAHDMGLIPDNHLVNILRALFSKVSQDARAVMLGGFTTLATAPAHVARALICPYCEGPPPYLEHILWRVIMLFCCKVGVHFLKAGVELSIFSVLTIILTEILEVESFRNF